MRLSAWIRRWFERKVLVPEWVGDADGWQVCWAKGHLAVNDIDGWLCIRCWTGFFMGWGFAVPCDMRERFRTGELVIVEWETAKALNYYERQYASSDAVIVGIADVPLHPWVVTKSPRGGGPPYVFELKA